MLTRRGFLAGGLGLAAATVISPCLLGAVQVRGKLSGYPFTLGVASGDPATDGVVLWTRLAPRPLEPGGGMSPEPVNVSWQVADDEKFKRIVTQGTAQAKPQWGHSVHVEVSGLRPDCWYWYRFKAAGELSLTGRTRTLPASGTAPDHLRFAFVSCQKYEMGYYTAYEHLAREDLDLVIHLGDYIYEKEDSNAAVRPHHQSKCMTLDGYRARYAIGKCDPNLQAAHAMAPWILTWDDHEVANDYANAISEHPDREPPTEFLLRRAAAYQAYYEHMPLRHSSLPQGAAMLIYRRLNFGQLAAFNVLDTRQYRTDQPCGGDTVAPCGGELDPTATIMGNRQREWLFNSLEQSSTRWNILAQQVQMARVDFTPGPELSIDMDKWAGYEAERRRLLRHLRDRPVANTVVLTGDSHENWANELSTDFDDPEAAPVAVELMGTSISSGGDGEDQPDYLESLLAENPFVKYHNSERGYVCCEVTADTWRTDFRTVPYITRPGAPVVTRASFLTESGNPRLIRL
ncbi:MAG: alkaline phosphatase D family protein [Cephaloticoccus sp.]|nr:alkaline phosphatase D family protein [Cephaloticoccus sp.]